MENLSIEPQGIFWHDDFVSPQHEEQLIQIFRNKLQWPDRPGRISLHYGFHFDYKTFGVDPDIPFKEFPDWLKPLIPTYEGRPPEQVCLQYYPPGVGIPPHVDTHSVYDQLYALSLGAPVSMQFRNGHRKVDIDLTPRSLIKMSGDSRLHWTHCIKKRKNDPMADGTVRRREDRWSITYRWLRASGECECGDAQHCDTAQQRNGVEREMRWKTYEADADGSAKVASATGSELEHAAATIS